MGWRATSLVVWALLACGSDRGDEGDDGGTSWTGGDDGGTVLGDPPELPDTPCTPTVRLREPFRVFVTFGIGGLMGLPEGPSLTEDLVLLVTSDGVEAFDRVDGSVRWADPRDLSWSVQAGPDFALVAFGETTGLACLELDDGALRWTFQPSEGYLGYPRLLSETTIVVAVSGEVVALDAATGGETWRTEVAPDTGIDFIAVGPDGGIYVAAYDRLVRLDQDGGETWSFATDRLMTVPAFGGGLAYVGTLENDLHAVDSADGTEVWSEPMSKTPNRLAMAAGDVLVASLTDFDAAEIVGLAGDTGQEMWSSGEMPSGSFPVVGAGGQIVHADLDGRLVILDPTTGDETWSYDLPAPPSTEPSVADDGILYCVAGEWLVAVDPDPSAVGPDAVTCPPCQPICEDEGTLQLCAEDGSGAHPDVTVECGEHFLCGGGACQPCEPHAWRGCLDERPTWFDACDRAEESDPPCGDGEACAGGRCGSPCALSCASGPDSAGLSCGDGAHACRMGYDRFDRPVAWTCSYSNRVSFTCTAEYDDLGEISGSCQGEGATCSF